MSFERKHLGRSGEEEVVSYLKKNGYRVLETNYRAKFGEIDIVASKKGAIVFVEVKTRIKQMNEVKPRSFDSGEYLPEDNIDWRKQNKLRKLGEVYLLLNDYPPRQAWQIDVVAVEVDPDTQTTRIRHIEQAVTR